MDRSPSQERGEEVDSSAARQSASEVPPPISQADMSRFLQTMETLMKTMATAGASSSAPPRREPESPYEQMIRMGAMKFDGTASPEKADAWLVSMTRIFALTKVTDRQKVEYASFFLEESAYHWWIAVEARYPDPASITWEVFCREFRSCYYPQPYIERQWHQFSNLHQGNMSVNEYVARFTDLCRFAPIQVSTEAEKCRHFERGLNREIWKQTKMQKLKNFAELVDAALTAEEIVEECQPKRSHQTRDHPGSFGGQAERPYKRFSGVESFQQESSAPPVGRTFARGSVTSWRSGGRSFSGPAFSSTRGRGRGVAPGFPHRFTPCPTCGRLHAGSCNRGPFLCFFCGQPGHIQRECPFRVENLNQGAQDQGQSSRNESTSGGFRGRGTVARGGASSSGVSTPGARGGGQVRPYTQGRIFAMSEQDALATPDVVTGTQEPHD